MNESVKGSESLSGLINFRCHSTFSTSHGRQLVGDFKRLKNEIWYRYPRSSGILRSVDE